jgi:ATP-dependent exoDNAse (exonuclease V) alpha subunit
MSINKAQGQSVKYTGMDLRTSVFTHGQLYVGLSRSTSAARVKVLFPSNDPVSENIVYYEVL